MRPSQRSSPAHFAGLGVTAHGDAHNANVWFEETRATTGAPRLSLFDPAFAGAHVPALLAEVKPTFHNIFAHPYWLYEPQVAATRFQARVERRGDLLAIETDWALSPLRMGFLELKGAALAAAARRKCRRAGNCRRIGGGS